LKQRFSSGTERGRKVYAKFISGRTVDDGAYTGIPHYSPVTEKISLDYTKDAVNLRGVGTTYFHEHGHRIDHMSGFISVTTKEFRKTLQDDYNAYIIKYMGANKITNMVEAYNRISQDLRKSDMLSAVSDILGGISAGSIDGGWKHRLSYWKDNPDNISIESFAHLFEAQFSEERLRIFSEYFPRASKEFKKILEGSL